MKTLIALLLFLPTLSALADRTFETNDEARQRHEVERYQQYKENNYQQPLGGYTEKLGDPAPYNYQEPQPYQYNQNQEDWRSRLKR